MRRVVGDRPGDDHLVADIGVHRSAMVTDRFVDIEKEASNQVVHLEFTHLFSEPGRAGDIKEHHDPLFTGRPMVGSQHDTGQHRTTDQPTGFGDRADDERDGEPNGDDPRQGHAKPICREPAQPEGLGVKHKLQKDADGDQSSRATG